MKSTYKHFTQIGLSALLCLLVTVPLMAQHRGGGGGGFTGGAGGGHVSAGGFSGGGRSIGVSPQRGSVSPRVSATSPNSGFGARSGQRGFVGRNGLAGNNAVAIGHRGYIPGSTGAGVYGHGGSYGNYGWDRYGGYFYNQGFYGSLYYPWLGLGFGFLPYGYYSFSWGGYPYYYSDGLFYQYNNNQYTVVEPPVGAAINNMPSGAQSIVINGQQYYEKNGVYYLPITKDDGTTVYQVAGKDGQLNTDATGISAVAPKVGDIITKLPPDCRKVKLNGATYFVSADGIYFQQIKDSNHKKAYKIVALGDDTTDQ